MTPEQWERVKDLVAAGLEERGGESRVRFIDAACGDDPVVRDEAINLIASFERAGRFMEPFTPEIATRLAPGLCTDSLVGHRIGPYEAAKEIGVGGMGAVYLAKRADETFDKAVAIKVLKRGMDSDGILRAFRTERQILATLDHPNVARLLDGGTTSDGRPYFVMDYVDGVPLDVYCARNGLSIPERLRLFRSVCDAVDNAHRHGVIHRDLKPGNILVTADGTPKLLDFGIAKVVNPDRTSTTSSVTTIGRPLTPNYASPEQITGAPITPASDVYSLGTVLYEMLTGRLPYRFTSHIPLELERVICEQDPGRPSVVVGQTEDAPAGASRRRLAGDLDTIVLTALRKEPERRYQSVGELSEDIRRHLENLPIRARCDTVPYRTTKFIRRNRAVVITAATSFALMLMLLGVVRIHPLTSRQQMLAVLPFEPLVAGARDEYLEVGLADALIAKLGRVPELRVRPTQQVLKYRGVGRNLQTAGRELGVDTLLVGGIQRDRERFRLSLNLVSARDGTVRWAQSFDEPWTDIFDVEDAVAMHVADALRVPLTGAESEHVIHRDTNNAAAYQEYLLGRHYWMQFTTPQLRRALDHFQRAVELDPQYAMAQAGIADVYTSFVTYRVLPPSEAYPRAKAAAEKAIELNPELSEPYSALGLASLYYDWDWPAAERHFVRAIRLDPNNAEARNRYALALVWFERSDEALREITRAREIDPLSVRINMNVGFLLYFARRYEDSIRELVRALALDPNFFQTHQTLGWNYVQTGAYDHAIAEFQKAIDLGAGSQVETDLAHAYAVSGHVHDANVLLGQILDRRARAYVSSFDIAVVYAGLGDRDQAFAWLEKAFAERTRPFLSLKVNPRLEGLHSDARFAALTQRTRAFHAVRIGSEVAMPGEPRALRR
jgi:serine/threonine-protein kinase